MTSDRILGQIASGANPMASAYQATSGQLEQRRAAEREEERALQRQRDDDMHQVFKFAGDGFVDEARFFAQQKGLEVPDSVYKNATFAKGLDIAGTIYRDDPERAQMFAQAFVQSEGDLSSRFANGISLAGKPQSISDRDFDNFVRKERWKLANAPQGSGSGFSLSPGQARYDAAGNLVAERPVADSSFDPVGVAMNAYNASTGGFSQKDPAEAARNAVALAREIQEQSRQQMNPQAAPQMNKEETRQRAIYDIQQLLIQGYTPNEIGQALMQRGATEDQVRGILSAAGVR